MPEKTLKFKHKFNGEKLEVTIKGNEPYLTALTNEVKCTTLSNTNWEENSK